MQIRDALNTVTCADASANTIVSQRFYCYRQTLTIFLDTTEVALTLEITGRRGAAAPARGNLEGRKVRQWMITAASVEGPKAQRSEKRGVMSLQATEQLSQSRLPARVNYP
jgi:hypothetical protein